MNATSPPHQAQDDSLRVDGHGAKRKACLMFQWRMVEQSLSFTSPQRWQRGGYHSGHCGDSGPQESVANVEVDEKGKKATQGKESQSESSFSAWA